MAKKSLFSMLRSRLAGAMVLDLYCGTGTMGIEALSEGAGYVCFAEKERSAVSRLRRNITACGVESLCEVWAGNIETKLPHWLEGLKDPVDVAFIDPPFPTARNWDFSKIATRLFDPLAAKLAPDGIIVLRTPADVSVPDQLGAVRRQRQKEYGQMIVTFYSHPHAR